MYNLYIVDRNSLFQQSFRFVIIMRSSGSWLDSFCASNLTPGKTIDAIPILCDSTSSDAANSR